MTHASTGRSMKKRANMVRPTFRISSVAAQYAGGESFTATLSVLAHRRSLHIDQLGLDRCARLHVLQPIDDDAILCRQTLLQSLAARRAVPQPQHRAKQLHFFH